MRDFVEKSDKFSTEGGPDFPVVCIKTSDEKGPLTIYSQNKDDCEEAKTKLVEIQKQPAGPWDTSSPQLVYLSIGLAALAIIFIVIGIVINIKSKSKQENE